MLEAQPLHGIGELDVHTEIVGVQLELIAFEQPAILIDVHRQRRDLASDIKLPMPVARWIGLEINKLRAPREGAFFTGHERSLNTVLSYRDMHNNACFGRGLGLIRTESLHFSACFRCLMPIVLHFAIGIKVLSGAIWGLRTGAARHAPEAMDPPT